MLELLLVLALTGGLVGGAALLSRVDWFYLFGLGLVMATLGLVLGAAAGLAYHLRLRRVILRQGPMPPRWWLFPTRLHDRLGDDKRWVLRPFFWGATGMAVTIAGLVFIAYGAWRSQ